MIVRRERRSKFSANAISNSISPNDDDAERLARTLALRSDYRVLRELNVESGLDALSGNRSDQMLGVVLDIETTGLDLTGDRPIEISVQRFLYDRSGRVIEVERAKSWLEDPGQSLPESISHLTGLLDEDLHLKRFDDDLINLLISDADLIIAHNARFDRPFFDRRFPSLGDSNWACSLTQIDWALLGFDGRALGYLTMQAGWFFQGHRAKNDVVALTTLLGTTMSDGRTILSHLLERSNEVTVRVDAIGAPFESKETLKGAGYRWDSARRNWWKEITERNLSSELKWLDQTVYFGRGSASAQLITPTERFRRA